MSVTLTRPDGGPILRKRDTWIIIHGLLSSKDAAGIKILTAAVDGASSKDQVLVADWRKLAPYFDNGDLVRANSQAAADALAALIVKAKLASGRINLIGFSMGGFVAGRLAEALKDRGGVNAIVGLDPSSPKVHINGGSKVRRAPVDFAAFSKYSIAFHGQDNGSPLVRALSADDTIRIDNLGDTNEERHNGVFDVFTNMTKINNSANPDAASRIFSLGKISRGEMPSWKKDVYNKIEGVGGYEAVIKATGVPGTLRPAQVVFVNLARHTRHIDGV
jgi:pimeloyl-ACP methyl ester carboxylesterase